MEKTYLNEITYTEDMSHLLKRVDGLTIKLRPENFEDDGYWGKG